MKILEAVLPPSEVRLRCVAKFLRENVNELDDVDTLATRVFGKATNITVEEGKVKLKTVIEYFKDILRASRSAPCKIEGINNFDGVLNFDQPHARFRSAFMIFVTKS